ncbi:MAG: hypothetical protein Q9198_000297 [Flavoplaca austrocitrina]
MLPKLTFRVKQAKGSKPADTRDNNNNGSLQEDRNSAADPSSDDDFVHDLDNLKEKTVRIYEPARLVEDGSEAQKPKGSTEQV